MLPTHKRLSLIQQDLREGKTSTVELVEAYLQRIDEKKDLNAFLEVFADDALAQAKEQDEQLKQGSSLGKLHGLVLAIKDNICYRNHHVSAGSKILEGYSSIYSSTVVERLLAEGAIIIGRTNCDEFAMGSSNENSAYGNVLNDIGTERVPGGSSGGSAVAVQANMCHASLGSDTGGSIRQPASFCGVVGMKPTYGRVSRYGLIAYASSFDQIGPFTHSVEDAALITQVMAGKDNNDATSAHQPVFDWKAEKQTPKKLAYFASTLEHPSISEEVRQATYAWIDSLKAEGHEVTAVDFELLDYLIPTYYVLSNAEASSNLARYDGVHFGYRSEGAKEMESVYVDSRTEGFGKEVKNRIMLGTFVLSAGYYDAFYGKAQRVRRTLKNEIDKIFENHDFIISPTSPTVAFKLGEKTENPVDMYMSDIFTVIANLVGAPAVSLPLYQNKEELPIGMQVMGKGFSEGDLLSFCDAIMTNTEPQTV